MEDEAAPSREEYCRKIIWKDCEDEGIRYVLHAGEILYLLKDNPFRK